MRKLLAAAAVSCLVGIAHADDKATAAPGAVDPAHAHTAQPAHRASTGASAAKKGATAKKKGAIPAGAKRSEPKGAAGEKPCEPVKPCPIE
jgi:hypothetical protein